MTLPAWLMELVPAVPALPEPVPEQVPTEKHQEIHNVKPYVPAVPDVPAQKQSLRECSDERAALPPFTDPPQPFEPKRQAAPDLPVGSMADDLAYIVKRLGELRLQPQAAQRVRLGYANVWTAAAEAEPLPHRRDNRGRYAANTWLRLLTREEAKLLPSA